MNVLKITALLSLLCPVIAVASEPLEIAAARMRSEFASLESVLLRTKEVITPSVRLTQRYKSMDGPKSTKSFQLETEPDNSRVWIRRYKITVLDEAAREESTEFLCHAWLMADSGRRNPESGHRGARGGRDPSLFLTISQGSEDTQFPDGFAVEFDSLDVSRVALLTMAANNNHDEIDKEIRFRATIDYLDDQAAQQLEIQPLTGFQLHARQELGEVKSVHHRHAGSEHAGHASGVASIHPPAQMGMMADHWLVPPGRQVLQSDVEPGVIEFDGMIHFIKIHLHPYGESVTLVDKSAGEEVWKGDARR